MTTPVQVRDCDEVGRALAAAYSDLRRRASKIFSSPADVDDRVQETCIRVLSACEEGRIQGPVRNFAFGVLRHTVLEALHGRKREGLPLLEDANPVIEALGPSLAPTPDEDPWEEYRPAFVRCWSEMLSVEEQRFLSRYHAHHGAGNQLASELGITTTAVALRAFKMRRSVRECTEARLASNDAERKRSAATLSMRPPR